VSGSGHRPARLLPSWFGDAKLGIFVLWTPSAVPAFAPLADPSTPSVGELPYSEMYLNSMHIEGSSTARHHAERYGGRPYDDFVREFREGVEHWDPKPWADLFAQAGAKYVILAVKHQDGFLLWPSKHPNPHKAGWQAERDVVGDLGAAVRARGLRFGALYVGGVDYTFTPPPFSDGASLQAAIPQHQEYADYVDGHWRELVERYELDVLWNNIGYPVAADPAALVEWYRERVPDGVTNDRFGPQIARRLEAGEQDGYTDFTTVSQSDDQGYGPEARKWELCRGVGTSFGYNRQEVDEHYASSTELIQELCDCVARGGNLLLGVGPTAAGNVPWSQAKRLLAIGRWLRENGAALYGTRPWDRPAGATAHGLPVRYTQSEDGVHAIVLGSPASAAIELDVSLADGAAATLLGGGHTLTWERTAHGTRVGLPELPDERPALALRFAPATAVEPR